MAKSEFDPELLLRRHFEAELRAEREGLPASPDRPRLSRGLSRAGQRDRRAWLPELAAAAVLAAAIGMAPFLPEGSLAEALAGTAIGGGGAAELGSILGQGLSAAVLAFAEGPRSGIGGEAPRTGRFK